jgi:hypothetical protein
MIKPSTAAAQSVGALRSVKWLSRHKRVANCATHLFHGPLDSSTLYLTTRASAAKTTLQFQPSCLGEFGWPSVGDFEVAIGGISQKKEFDTGTNGTWIILLVLVDEKDY